MSTIRSQNDPPDEQFEVFDETGARIGLVPRPVVHREGLWHRSVHLFLFDPAGRLWLQRRGAGKDLYPNRLDYSVGEHLQPGEAPDAGIRRGLAEELGIEGAAIEPLGPTRRMRIIDPARGIHDCEIQQGYRATWDGALRPDPVEVAEVALFGLDELADALHREPCGFTPWCRRELEYFRFVPVP